MGNDGCPCECISILRRADESDLQVLLYRCGPETGLAPATLYIHGGGFLGGTPVVPDEHVALFRQAGAVVVSVSYRVATQAPFPAPVEDCYAALAWLFENADMLGVDPARISVVGESAGGGLAAALSLLARDRGEYALKSQLLLYPMLDSRTGTTAAPVDNPYTGRVVWDREWNRVGWNAMRGNGLAKPEPIGHFSPALETNLSALPPTLIVVGTLDLFLEEDVDYAMRLCRSGVSVECLIYPEAAHGFDLLQPEFVERFRTDFDRALRRLL